jgi:hypothetical protein
MLRLFLGSRCLPLAFVLTMLCSGPAFAQNPAETAPPEHKRADPQQTTPGRPETPPLVDQFAQTPPTDAELRTVSSVLLLNGIVPPASRPNPPELKD